MTVEKQVATDLQCSDLSAKEMVTVARSTALQFAALHDRYDLTHVIQARRTARHMILFDGLPDRIRQSVQDKPWSDDERRAVVVKYIWKQLPRAAVDLFRRFESTRTAVQQFRTAFRLSDPGRSCDFEDALTVCLSALHDANALRLPEKVSDGRLAYQSIERDHELLRYLGTPGT